MPTHSFEHITPPARFDGVPWTRVLAEESPLDGSAWVEVADEPIAVDLTPDEPNPVALTVTDSSLEVALFRFRFDVTPSNPSTYSSPVMSPAPPYRPTVEQVAAILRARTRGPASRDAAIAGEQGTFTTTTRPTRAQVEEDIDIAVGELVGMMGGRTPCTPQLGTAAGTAAVYRAAQLVEIGYTPEQTGDTDTTATKALERLWTSASQSVIAAVIAQCPLVVGGAVNGDPIGRVPLYDRTGWHTPF